MLLLYTTSAFQKCLVFDCTTQNTNTETLFSTSSIVAMPRMSLFAIVTARRVLGMISLSSSFGNADSSRMSRAELTWSLSISPSLPAKPLATAYCSIPIHGNRVQTRPWTGSARNTLHNRMRKPWRR